MSSNQTKDVTLNWDLAGFCVVILVFPLVIVSVPLVGSIISNTEIQK